ncbi:P-type conjugative transfer protein VirB9 [Pseudoduganella chitinolytica]|uniref:P-type conjugative transfer protein VirB9 n=1 Tax=Pseudoduganella chitinolytica TaxID=34070 RepID=A0ABY8B9P0_9BURK|nr:P-type conjugative transfer protein VirB9 [Pseudoduganella chitinolytica]WEF31462.1 P-type conjugative transfer protein VirB9 [Pseudoduganella chitinolytica]
MKRFVCIALFLPTLALAELTPPKGAFDSRVRVVDYNPADVVRLSTFYGVSTHVQFADKETIKDVAVGDVEAWEIIPRGTHLFIKPKAHKADTNVTVVTDKRVYQFALIVQPRKVRDDTAWRDPNLVFSLSFRYPDDEAAKATTLIKAMETKAAQIDMQGRMAEAKKREENNDYWVAGSSEVSPTAARDDGRFIYLTFSRNRDMPAVYAVDKDGAESLINTNVEGNAIVVQRMVRKLILRKGKAVACVINKSFDLDGGSDNTSGTVAPDVERVIKGAQ